MTKSALWHPDPLVMKVRKLVKAIEPRPEPTERRKNAWGHWCVVCPDCGQLCYAKAGSYNHHWTLEHGTPFWKELELIKLIRKDQRYGNGDS